MTTRPDKKNISFQQVISSLLDTQTPFPPVYLHQFSDLEGSDLDSLRTVWPQVHPDRRFSLLEDLENLAEVDTLVLFDNLALFALNDSDPRVRTVAIRLLWEHEDPDVVDTFFRILREDEDTNVRAAAAAALGKFVYLGEVEDIPVDILHDVESHLLEVMGSQDSPLVRRRALESLGFSGRSEVPSLIRTAYNTGEPDWLASALFAIGRSADETWGPDVLRMLRYPRIDVQIEAVRAAGELALDTARDPLLRLLEEEIDDNDLRIATIWSLSQIGGEDVRETVEKMGDETEDEEEAGFLEDALDNLSFTEDADVFNILDIDPNLASEESATGTLSNTDYEEGDPDLGLDLDEE
jgi:HEAT repeat protein